MMETGCLLDRHVLERPRLQADLRREITPWRALVWAYADECVGQATNAPEGHHLYASPGLAQYHSYEYTPRGTINGRIDAHEDALAIDAFVWRAVGGDAKCYHLIAAHAARRAFMAKEPVIPPLCCGPKLRENGRPEMLYPLRGRNEPYLCLVEYRGTDPEEAARQRRLHAARYEVFIALLACLQDLVLSRWKIVGLL